MSDGTVEELTQFERVIEELKALHNRKRQDYGTDQDPFANIRASAAWGVPAWMGALIRATDKLYRLQAYARRGALANETVEDSLRDLAVYAIIGLMLWEEEQHGT